MEDYLRGRTAKCQCGRRCPTKEEAECEYCYSDRAHRACAAVFADADERKSPFWYVILPSKVWTYEPAHGTFACRTCRSETPVQIGHRGSWRSLSRPVA